MIGKIFGNRYEIIERLGGGGMAIVYKGRDTVLNRMVTIKVLRPEYTSDEEFVRRFRREAQAVASLSHPNIVSIYDVGREGDVHYLVMEYIDGEDLKSVIRREGVIEPGRAVNIARQISEALDHAHENNIVHRDVKPHNILITKNGRPKLSDFGIAREATAATVTQTDTIVGSVHYLSPEQARGELAGPKSDIYSLGVVLYEMLTGTVPYSGDSAIAIAIKHIQEEPPPASLMNPKLNKGLEQLVLKAMQKNPEHRYASAGEISKQLGGVLNEDNGTASLPPLDDMATVVLKKDYLTGDGFERESAAQKGREDGKKHKRKVKPVILTLALTLLGLSLGALVFAFNNFINVSDVVVPSVVGKELEEAQEILREHNLSRWDLRKEHSKDVLEGHIIKQDPAEGEKVKSTREIVLTVSQGPDYRVVPDLTGMEVSEARISLIEEELALDEDNIEYGFDDNVAKDRIYHQVPGPNGQLHKGSKVKVHVSKGPQPAAVEVPDLRKLTLEQARAKLTEKELVLNEEDIAREQSSEYLNGRVIRQSPTAGERVDEGAEISITLSSGPGPEARDITVLIENIPDGDQDHDVKIEVDDARGREIVYRDEHFGGDRVVRNVTIYGQAIVRVYVDDILVDEKIR